MQPGREVNRSPRCNAGVNNGQSYSRTTPCLHGVHRDKITFLPVWLQDIYTNITLHAFFPVFHHIYSFCKIFRNSGLYQCDMQFVPVTGFLYAFFFYKTVYQNFTFTYLLTPWGTVLLEKLTGSAASQEIPRVFGTRRFITVLTSARHLSLSWANSIQSPQPPPTSWRSIIFFSYNLYFGKYS